MKRLDDGALFIATQGSPFRDSSGWAECSGAERATLTDVVCAD